MDKRCPKLNISKKNKVILIELDKFIKSVLFLDIIPLLHTFVTLFIMILITMVIMIIIVMIAGFCIYQFHL